jgi:RNA polymerase sigma-70 factor (ECF subfamily)
MWPTEQHDVECARGGEAVHPPPAAEGSDGVVSDERIVQRVLAGDLAAYELIMRRYNQRLFRVVRAIVRDSDEAEDVLQETYVRAYEHLGQFEGRSRFSTWLTRIAVHEAAARRRRQRRMHPFDASEHDTPDAAEGGRAGEPERGLIGSELGAVLTDAVDSLPEEMRLVFTLRVMQGLDTAETSACLSMSASNVKVQLHRARVRLRTRLSRAIGEEACRLHQFDGERCDRVVAGVLSRLAGRGSGSPGDVGS